MGIKWTFDRLDRVNNQSMTIKWIIHYFVFELNIWHWRSVVIRNRQSSKRKMIEEWCKIKIRSTLCIVRFNVGRATRSSSGSASSSNDCRRYSDPIMQPPKVTDVFCMKYATDRPIELPTMCMMLCIHWFSFFPSTPPVPSNVPDPPPTPGPVASVGALVETVSVLPPLPPPNPPPPDVKAFGRVKIPLACSTAE